MFLLPESIEVSFEREFIIIKEFTVIKQDFFQSKECYLMSHFFKYYIKMLPVVI